MINSDLWDAINQYVRACGGDPETKKVSAKRLVPVIEQEVRLYRRDAFEKGLAAALREVLCTTGHYGEVGRAIDRINNPYEGRNEK